MVNNDELKQKVVSGMEYLVSYRNSQIEAGTWNGFNNEEVKRKLDELGCLFNIEDLAVSEARLKDLSLALSNSIPAYNYAAYLISKVYDDEWIEQLSEKKVKAGYFFENDPLYSAYSFLHIATGKSYWPPELTGRSFGELYADFIVGDEKSYNSMLGKNRGKIKRALLNTRNSIMESFDHGIKR